MLIVNLRRRKYFKMFVPILLHIVIPFIIFVTIGLYVYYKYFIFTFWSKRGIRYLKPTFLIGNLHPFLSTSAADIFSNLCQQYKEDRFVGLYFFHTPVLLLTDPQLIRIVLQEEFHNFDTRGFLCDAKVDPLMNNVFCVSGDKWKHLRSRMKSAYSPARVKQMLQLWEHGSNSLSKFLRAKAESQTTFEVVHTITSYVADIISGSAFGITTNAITENGPSENPFSMNRKNVFGINTLWIVLFTFFPNFFKYTRLPFTPRKVRKFFLKFVEDLIEYRTTNNIQRNDIFDAMMQLTKSSDVTSDNTKNTDNEESAHMEFGLEDVVANSFVIYVAGHDTTSLTTTYCLYELAMNPDIQDKIRKELTSVLEKHGAVTYDALSEMTYLDKVLSETLRKYPIPYLLPRVCNRNTQLPTTNIHIPKGLRIVIPMSGIHWDPDTYPDPQKFDPERFNKENIASRPPNTYFPFGQGPRMCVAGKMSLTMMKFTIAMNLTKYRFRRVPQTPESITFGAGRLLLEPASEIPLAVDLL